MRAVPPRGNADGESGIHGGLPPVGPPRGSGQGFASDVYGLLVVQSDVPGPDVMFHLIAIVVVGSILLHSSTDVEVAKQFSGLDDLEHA